ncbi:MAG: hypothetical protein H0U49_03490 [Parachlamydiaceae bacterium]|nr:hypothetical protein [Parachlamydiaceae bacterium]
MRIIQKIKAISCLVFVLAAHAYGNYDSYRYYHTPQPHPPLHGYNNVYPYYESPSFTYYYNYPYGGYYNKKFHDQKSHAQYNNYRYQKQMADQRNRYYRGYQQLYKNPDFDRP